MSCAASHFLAKSQSRFTVATEIPSASALSPSVKPKERSSTTFAARGSSSDGPMLHRGPQAARPNLAATSGWQRSRHTNDQWAGPSPGHPRLAATSARLRRGVHGRPAARRRHRSTTTGASRYFIALEGGRWRPGGGRQVRSHVWNRRSHLPSRSPGDEHLPA
jgi:hypothetical protein